MAEVPETIRHGDGDVWADVSPLIQSACNDLQDGELIHGENFSLFAAMSALEAISKPFLASRVKPNPEAIMDPKMDSGMDCSGYQSIEDAIENGAAPIPFSSDRTINVHCCIDMMDHLLACEATWHKGHSLTQTVFSCIYLLRIERTSSHPLLHSYCRIVRATCNTVISAVSDARTHEEEDLFTMSFGLPLKPDGDDKCLSILNGVEETISLQLRACRAQSAEVLEDMETLQTNPDLEEGYCRALLCRLRFRKHFYHILKSLKKTQGRGLELAKKHISSCLSEIANMYKSQEFLRCNAYEHSSDDAETSTTASGCQPIGFDSSLNSRLLAPAPPRAIKILEWKIAIQYFEKLLQDLNVICSFPMDPMLEDVKHFVVQFQRTEPDLVARAYLQLLLVQDGKLYGRDLFHDVIARAIALPEGLRNQEFHKNEFVLQLVQLVINLLKLLCTNIAWQRRKLGKILQDWRVISMQLELAMKREVGDFVNSTVDENVSVMVPKHLFFWAEEQTYWIAARYLTLGFELELSKERKEKERCLKDFGRDITLSSSCLLLQCYVCLSEGLALMLAALRNERMDFEMPSRFNTEEERFIQHFELLQKAHVPDQVSYYLFKESTRHAGISNVVQNNYFREVKKIATSLRGSFSSEPDRLDELRRLEQVAEHNRIAASVINQAGVNDSALRVSVNLNLHPVFAVAVVKRS